jgi:thiopeptide-type bacteriocin biosynthesis protein
VESGVLWYGLIYNLSASTATIKGVGSPATDRRWSQYDLAPSPVPSVRDAAIATLLRLRADLWLENDVADLAFFTRKPPGIRLRVRHGVNSPLPVRIELVLNELRCAGVVRTWSKSRYEAEWRKFGGREIMEAVHRYFTADTTGWLRLASGDTEGVVAKAVPMTAAIVDDLFVRLLVDRDEVWDAWCNCAALTHSWPYSGPEDDGVPGRAHQARWPVGSELRLWYENANAELSEAARAAWSRDLLDAGLRAWAAVLAEQVAHRWGAGATAWAGLCSAMRRARDPRGGLRGAGDRPR